MKALRRAIACIWGRGRSGTHAGLPAINAEVFIYSSNSSVVYLS